MVIDDDLNIERAANFDELIEKIREHGVDRLRSLRFRYTTPLWNQGPIQDLIDVGPLLGVEVTKVRTGGIVHRHGVLVAKGDGQDLVAWIMTAQLVMTDGGVKSV